MVSELKLAIKWIKTQNSPSHHNLSPLLASPPQHKILKNNAYNSFLARVLFYKNVREETRSFQKSDFLQLSKLFILNLKNGKVTDKQVSETTQSANHLILK